MAGLLASSPYWIKLLFVVVFGSLAYSLMQAAEFARQDYEMSVCTTNSTGVDVCDFNSASTKNLIIEGSVAVSAMGVAAIAANAFAPPTMSHMRLAFVPFHFWMVLVWYFFSLALTLVPLIYTCYLLYSQVNHQGSNLYVSDPATDNVSALLAGLEGLPEANPCNPSFIYCLSIPVGLLAGFGYLFAGATAFWAAWLVMDDTAHKILRGEAPAAEPGVDGAYFSAVPSAEPVPPEAEPVHISQLR